MFDWTQRGEASTHRYRGYYDAGFYVAPHCAQCNRAIRFCYSLHDQHMKSFVIGTCCFQNYTGKTLLQLEAAKLLQEATRDAIVRDTKLYGALSNIRDRRKQWQQARREALRLLRLYRQANGDWLPKELFELRSAVLHTPRQYKLKTRALRWYENQTSALVAKTKEANSMLISSSR